MKLSADQALSPPPGAGAPGTSASVAGNALPAHAGVGNGVVLVYLSVAMIVLAPGLWLRFGPAPDPASLQGLALGQLERALHDIRFGSGLRFWLGVAGTTLMALLLFYPLRKALARGRGLGSIGRWFHLHIVIGIAGPVLILYHCNFGTGGRNANVALWSMLAIALSGLLGQLVYRRVTAGFYGDKSIARGHLDAIRRLLGEVHGLHVAKTRLLDELEQFDATLLDPRRGVFAGFGRQMRIEERGIHFHRDIERMMRESLRTQTWPAGRHRHVHLALDGHLRDYIRVVRSGAAKALREQLWARWRLFHLPLFLLMSAAVALHVYAVWDMDAPTAQSASEAGARPQAAKGAAQPDAPRRSPVQQLAVKTSRIDAAAEGGNITMPAPEAAGSAPAGTPPADARPPRQTIDRAGASTDPIAAKLNETTDPPQSVLLAPPAPRPAARPAAKDVGAVKQEDRAAPRPEPPRRDPPSTAAAPPKPAPTAIEAVAETPRATAPASSAASAPPAATVDNPKAAIAELQRLASEAPAAMMNLGVKGRSLSDQITILKQRRAEGSFSHSLAETGFPLVGKHAKAECMSCHQKPLREGRAQTQRQCIDCHKQDDVHRGRRPDCAQCHTPNRWSQILKGAKKKTRDD